MLERRAMDLLDTRRPRLLLAAFCLLLWLPGFFTLPPTDRDESRFAQASKQMLETGDFVRIMNGAEARNRKPIGIYWLQVPFAAAAHVTGLALENPIWPYRLPSLLGGLGAVGAVFGFGEALVGRRAALLAAGMLAASVVVVVEVHLAKTDAALLGATTLAMGVLGRAYLWPGLVSRWQAAAFWLAMGGGILLKGPITPLVAGLTAVSLVAWDRRAAWLRALRPGWGAPLMLLVVLPWFIAIGVATHGAFFHDAIGGDLAGKLSGGDDAHGAPPGLHLLLLPLLAFPSSFAVVAAAAAWRLRREPAIRFLLAWLVPCWLVFELVPTKLPHYTLPLYPALCLLGARWCLDSIPGLAAPARRWWRAFTLAALVLAAFVLGAGALAMPAAVGASIWLGVPACVAAALACWQGRDRRTILAALAAMPLLTLALLGWELPHVTELWIAPAVERAVVAAGLSGQRLGVVGFHEPSLMFLAGTTTDLLPDGAAGARALALGQVSAVVIGDHDEAAFRAENSRLGVVPHASGIVTGLNYSRGRQVVLHLYKP